MNPVSYNKKTMDGVQACLASGRIERTKEKSHTFKVSMQEKARLARVAEEARRKAIDDMNRARLVGWNKSIGLNGVPMSKDKERDIYELNISGTAVENNKVLREALIKQRALRDKFLEKSFTC